MTRIYNSRDARCKQPFGALPIGERATFRIFLPKAQQNTDPVMKLYEMDRRDNPLVLPMRFCGADLVQNSFECEFVPGSPGLLCYCFEIFSNGRLISIMRGPDGEAVPGDGGMWQLTAYDAAIKAPEFLLGGVMYQIFPDRFFNSGEPKENVPPDRTLRADWGGMPLWRPADKKEVINTDYFCGDLAGIEQKLDYLESMGVTVIYLNPVFEAHSNHRYNTASYERIDPLLGTNEDFANLAKAAEARGISLILDGVFSHTGSDSVYFNKNRRYGDGGAYCDPQSPYRQWYHFKTYPDEYDCWWGFDTLPNVHELNRNYLEYICGENGILQKWMELGAAGFRLDVADELPDAFLEGLHRTIKRINPNAILIGEVWEDASNKVSYGVRCRYFTGEELDSVTNYPYKNAILDFVTHQETAQSFARKVMDIVENYPKPVLDCTMNILSTHDTMRSLTAIGTAGQPVERAQQARFRLTDDALKQAVEKQKTAAFLQFVLPGCPCIYYGDEVGVQGFEDPYNRTYYPWQGGDQDLLEFYRQLTHLKNQCPALQRGTVRAKALTETLFTMTRKTADQTLKIIVNVSKQLYPYEQGAAVPVFLHNCEKEENRIIIKQNGCCVLQTK